MENFQHKTKIKEQVVCKVISANYNNTCIAELPPKNVPANKSMQTFTQLEKQGIVKYDRKIETQTKNKKLKYGDIVLIEPGGNGTILARKDSNSNAVLVTEECNSKCIMCPQPPKKDSQDHTDISIKTISLLEPDTKVIGITGGEPTVAWNALIKILRACQTYIPQARIELLTNARNLKDYSKAEKLAQAGNKNLAACVPIYADTSQDHDMIVKSSGAFWDALKGVYNLERSNIPVEIRNVITRQNYKRLPAWAEFIYKNIPFTYHVAIMGIEPMGLALKNLKMVWIDPTDTVHHLEEAIKILHRRGINVSIYNYQHCTMHRNLWKFMRKAISDWKNMYMPECMDCTVRADCGGFFQSSETIKSRSISPVSS